MTGPEALQLVYEAIDVVNPQLPKHRRLAKSPETILVGPSGQLDSLGLVTFIVALEERAGDRLGTPVQLLDETTLLRLDGPMRNVSSLARLLEDLAHA